MALCGFLRRKFIKDGDTRGIKAKTVYPPMPVGECRMMDHGAISTRLNSKQLAILRFADLSPPHKTLVPFFPPKSPQLHDAPPWCA